MLTSKIKHALSILFAIILFAGITKAQDFKAGFYIDQNNQKVDGFFEFSLFNTPQSFNFKRSLEVNPESLDASDMKSAQIWDYRFVTANVKINAIRKEIYNEQPEPQFKEELTVLQLVLDGTVSLLYYEEETGKENYYIRENGEMTLLVFQPYQVRNPNGDVVKKDLSQFKGQLFEMFGSCTELRSKFQTVAYQKNNLIKLIKGYNACQSYSAPSYVAGGKLNLSIEGLVGMHSTSIDFDGDVITPPILTDFEQSTRLAFGLNAWTPLVRNEKLMFNLSLLYTDLKTSGNSITIFGPMRSRETESFIEMSHIKASLLPHYRIVSNKIDVLIGAGISWGIGSEKQNLFIDSQVFGSGRSTNETTVYNIFDSLEIGYLGSLRVNYKDYSLNLRHELGSGFSRDPALNSNTTRTYLMLGYTILNTNK